MQENVFEVDHVSLVYGSRAEESLALLAKGANRELIRDKQGDTLALHDVSFSLCEGEILVLMGGSGSGKSSLLRCLNGLNGRGGAVGLLSGQMHILHKGQRIALHAASERQWQSLRSEAMAMVFQQANLLSWRTVGENLALPLEFKGLPEVEIRERVQEKLALVQLEAWQHRYPRELSGGMQQRVGIARALVTDAPVLLMDEPFSALDPLLRAQLQDEVLKLNQKLGKTIIFVTHDRQEALKLGHRIAVMHEGRLLQIDKKDKLQVHPKHSVVEALLFR